MLCRLAIQCARRQTLNLRHCRRLTHVAVRPWYRRVWPIAVGLVSASLPISYIIYQNSIGFNKNNKFEEEDFDHNSESVSQSELDRLLTQTEQLLNSELYQNRSSIVLVPLRLFFRTVKLIIIFTPVLIFYIYQHKFAPHRFDQWCFFLKRFSF